ncbi:MAG: hypothetical protein F6K58_02505 [Symploca sp. SIO2E9]|nr:hypothetical protein [Symploca sp. SIO2E9]
MGRGGDGETRRIQVPRKISLTLGRWGDGETLITFHCLAILDSYDK